MFLRNELPSIFTCSPSNDTDFADLFYKDIRCGILHSAQTKKYSMLSCDCEAALSYIDYGTDHVGIRVGVNKLSDALENYFYNDYLIRLRDWDDATRNAFINKMNFICSRN